MPDATTLPAFETLTVHTARAAFEQGRAAILAGQSVIDLSGLKTADSSAVAVLIAWQRAAREAGVALSYRNVPEGMQSLAALYGVSGLLGAAPADLHHH